MPETIKAVYLHGPGDLRLQDDPYPHLTDPHDVLLRLG